MNETLKSLALLMQSAEQQRFLRLRFPRRDAPEVHFAVHQIEAEECLSRDFSFKVQLVSDEPCLSLKEMQGKLLNVTMIRADGGVRYFSGYVFGFRRIHSDGALTLYEAHLGPWTKLLSLRRDSYLFHGKSLREQSEIIFKDYSFYPRWEWLVMGEDPPMTDACQFDETDFNYLSRRWEAAGWHYFYRHDEQGHTLVVASDSTRCLPIDGGPEVRFHDQGGTDEEDGMHRWISVREIVPASVALSSFNFKDPWPISRNAPTINQQGCVPHVESHEFVGAYGFRDGDAGYEMAKLRMEEIEAVGKFHQGEGNSRYMEPGRYFRLVDHFNHGPYGRADANGKDDFLILSIRHKAVNNVLQRGKSELFQYHHWLTCSRRSVPWRPGRQFNSEDTRISAPQTATVVGLSSSDSILTDEYGRVRVQFHWDRIGSNDHRSSAWIRVAGPWAGAELGSAAIPRVGSEVVVHWLSGDPDRPIILAALANRRNMPPWTLPEQRALTGWRSRELATGAGNAPGGRGNHLVLDDTPEQLQVQLKSDHQCSQLSLGYIVRISKDAASQIHFAMAKFYQSLFAQGKTCRPDPQGGAWAYEAEFDEALLAFRTMSIVFNVTSACAGSHVFDKVGWTFDISTGKQLLPLALINRYAPSLRKAGVRTNGNFLQLNKDAVALVMSNLKPEKKTACLDYFERSNYGVWLDEQGDVVLSPVFDYRYLDCAGRYYLSTEK